MKMPLEAFSSQRRLLIRPPKTLGVAGEEEEEEGEGKCLQRDTTKLRCALGTLAIPS